MAFFAVAGFVFVGDSHAVSRGNAAGKTDPVVAVLGVGFEFVFGQREQSNDSRQGELLHGVLAFGLHVNYG